MRIGTQLRERIWGGALIGADIRARAAREEASAAIRAAERAEAWSIRMEGLADRRSPRPASGNA